MKMFKKLIPTFLVGIIAIMVVGCENMPQMPPIVQINLAPSVGSRSSQPQYSSRMGSAQPRTMFRSGQVGDPYNRPYYEEGYSDSGFARSVFSQPVIIDPFGNTIDRLGRPINRFGRCLSGNELMRFGRWWTQEQLRLGILPHYPVGLLRGRPSRDHGFEPTCHKTRQPVPHKNHHKKRNVIGKFHPPLE